MKITRIEVWNFRPPFRDGPYAMAHVTQTSGYGRILRVHTACGLTGLGEIVFAPSVPIDVQQRLIAGEPDYLGPLVGQDIEALDEVAKSMCEAGKPECGVAFGLDTALVDLQARRQNLSVAEFLGGALVDAVDDYFSISERSTEKVRERVEIAGPQRVVIQLKLGVGSIDDDTVQIAAALDSMSENQLLLADANTGWTVDAAREIISRFDDSRVMWEEPCKTYEQNVQVAQTTGRAVMFDQCIGNVELTKRAVDEGVAAAVCIKPAFLGGLSVARKMRDLCARANVKMRIDGPWCGDIASAAILHLAVGAPPDLLIAGCDLREPLLIDWGLRGVRSAGSARIAPPRGIGLGIDATGSNFPGEPERVLG